MAARSVQRVNIDVPEIVVLPRLPGGYSARGIAPGWARSWAQPVPG